jgi:transposase
MTLEEALQVIERQQQQIEELLAENRRLRERVEELEREVARQAAPFRREEARKVPPGQQKRPGRKEGHRGSRRPAPRQIDERIEVPLPECPQCGGKLTDRSPLAQIIEEIPPVRPRVYRLVTWSGTCAKCGVMHSTHPLQTSRGQGAAGVQLGPRARSLAILLNKHLGLPLRRTCQVLAKLCGLRVTPGGLVHLMARAAERVEPQYEQLLAELRGSPAVNADETSWWVGGPKWWLWTFTTPQTTVYRVEQRRNAEVVQQTLGDYQGVLVSDCLSSYDPAPYRKHKCIAHHLRAIRKARDRPDTKDPGYLNRWQQFFKTVLMWHRLQPMLAAEDFAQGRAGLHRTCDQLLAEACTQRGDVAVRNRLTKQRDHLLGCLDNPAVEPTNNRAERALRPAVIARKLSCGNKTPRGKRTFEILASLAATWQQRAHDLVALLTNHLILSPQAG